MEPVPVVILSFVFLESIFLSDGIMSELQLGELSLQIQEIPNGEALILLQDRMVFLNHESCQLRIP